MHADIAVIYIWPQPAVKKLAVRGGKTAAYQVDPDIVFAIDVANNPELVKNYTNHRQIGKGCMNRPL